MGRVHDTEELNKILDDEGFRGNIPDEIEIQDEQLEECEIDNAMELEGVYSE